MKLTLMEHQKLGLAWMKKMEEGTNKGGKSFILFEKHNMLCTDQFIFVTTKHFRIDQLLYGIDGTDLHSSIVSKEKDSVLEY